MRVVLDDALTSVNSFIENRDVEFNISSLPKVKGDYNLLRQMWVNLIDNAIKYTKTRTKAIIKIDYMEESDEFIFSVSDHGVGFDLKYARNFSAYSSGFIQPLNSKGRVSDSQMYEG